jgi:hypothetical protein
MELQKIGIKYNTDKATYHKYLDFYEQYLNLKKDTFKKILEIGIKDGASIRMWREWLNVETIIEGWDINNIPTIENTVLKNVNQTKRKEILENITGIYDLILDDGLHSQESIETSFACLFPFCRTYIIEDLHAPWCEKIYEAGKFTIDNIENLMHHKIWNSNFTTSSEKLYIETFASVEHIFLRGTRENPLSISTIIKNLFYE